MPIIKTVLMTALFSLAASCAAVGDEMPAARPCGTPDRQEVLRPSPEPHTLQCSLSLRRNETIKRPIVIEGADASGLTLDCAKGAIAPAGDDPAAIAIRSRLEAGKWSRPSDVTISNCVLHGNVRIWGRGRNGEDEAVRRSSLEAGHTQRLQESAPTRIAFKGVRIVGSGTIPFYIAPGVTRVSLSNSVVSGVSRSVAIYLDAESADNRVVANEVRTLTERELVAIDGSAGNIIADNRFSSLQNGGIYLYRNCGEGGTVRHQAPQHNVIRDNHFFYRRYSGFNPAVWIGSRMGRRSYCAADAGHPFGSSIDNRDFARHNIVENNTIRVREASDMIRVSDRPNRVAGNVSAQQ